MNSEASASISRDLMEEYARLTGLSPVSPAPRRYLWTDAFAVCNFLELYRRTKEEKYRELALRLIEQVHHILGRHRDDDRRTGWISGLDEEEGRKHPTAGGLRIGKKLKERSPADPYDERLEWERDGQYYHYLTKWMHALDRVGTLTGDPIFNSRALELAKAAHAGFAHAVPSGGKRLYWKMSIGLDRPLVPSMGQHDPLDGLVTYSQLQASASRSGAAKEPALDAEIADLAEICRGMHWETDDPLGIGGLLFDACRMVQMILRGRFGHPDLLGTVLKAAHLGLESIARGNLLLLSADYRLAFRELGLSIGLRGVEPLRIWVGENPDLFDPSLAGRIEALAGYTPLAETIEAFWVREENQKKDSWMEHREINMVMLTTSLSPEGFLLI